MKVTVKYFGMVADTAKCQEEVFDIENGFSITDLKVLIEKKYPEIIAVVYSVALNKKLLLSDVILNENDEIALLPPFAGG